METARSGQDAPSFGLCLAKNSLSWLPFLKQMCLVLLPLPLPLVPLVVFSFSFFYASSLSSHLLPVDSHEAFFGFLSSLSRSPLHPWGDLPPALPSTSY